MTIKHPEKEGWPLGVGVTVSAGRADALAEEGAGRFFRKRLLAEGELDEAIRVMTTLNRAACGNATGSSALSRIA